MADSGDYSGVTGFLYLALLQARPYQDRGHSKDGAGGRGYQEEKEMSEIIETMTITIIILAIAIVITDSFQTNERIKALEKSVFELKIVMGLKK